MNQIRLFKENASDTRLNDNRPLFRRSVYTIGLILRYFDFKSPSIYGDYPVRFSLFLHMMLIVNELAMLTKPLFLIKSARHCTAIIQPATVFTGNFEQRPSLF